MSFVLGMNRFIAVYLSVFRHFFKGRLWWPFVLYALLQFLVLLAVKNYVHPMIYPVLSPIIGLFGERPAQIFSHYPGMFLMLPSVAQWIKLALGVLFEGLAVGLVSVSFLRLFSQDRPTAALAFGKWPSLLIVWTIITAILMAINWFLPNLFSDILYLNPRRQFVFGIWMRLLTVVVYAVFIYAVPSIIVYKNNIGEALKDSLRLFFRHPFFTFFLALVPYLLSVPISYILENVDTIVTKFTPELVFYLVVVGLIIDMVVNLLVTGTVVKFLIEEKAAV
ncbi:MAG: hypothetical protein JW763_06825 [candidate division Zixibacteria bacterium]|nr:hypothetical protein [candidate division Zixibacteria bacterium]